MVVIVLDESCRQKITTTGVTDINSAADLGDESINAHSSQTIPLSMSAHRQQAVHATNRRQSAATGSNPDVPFHSSSQQAYNDALEGQETNEDSSSCPGFPNPLRPPRPSSSSTLSVRTSRSFDEDDSGAGGIDPSIMTRRAQRLSSSSLVSPTSSGAHSTASCAEQAQFPSPQILSQSTRDSSSSVRVAVRVRPLLGFESGSDNCISLASAASESPSSVPTAIQIGGNSGPRFTFDQVFGMNVTQASIYHNQIASLVDSCLEGYNATVVAYGQTGSGKTYTMMGPAAPCSPAAVEEGDVHAGVIPRALTAIFEKLQQQQLEFQQSYPGRAEMDVQVRVQFLELYGEEIRDLLTTSSSAGSNEKLSIRDLGEAEPDVVGATQKQVRTADEALLCLTHGMLRRVTGSTAMNAASSRSHAILSVLVEQSRTTTASGLEEPRNGYSTLAVDDDRDDDGVGNGGRKQRDDTTPKEQHVEVKRSKFNFVDLAGSERQKRTQSSGKRLQEGIDINKGLLVLGNVISALGDPKKRGKTFVPYRDSKLTRLLKGSLGGNHKTLMIACVSPSSTNLEESLNCLRYANRAKNIQNNATVNLDASSRLVAELRQQVQVLASDLLRAWDAAGDSGPGVSSFTSSLTLPRDKVQALASGQLVGSNGTTTVSGIGSAVSNSGPRLSAMTARTPSSSGVQRYPLSTAIDTPSASSMISPGFGGPGSEYRGIHFQQGKQPPSASTAINRPPNAALQEKLKQMELELSKTREQLRESQHNHDLVEEQLYGAKAARELYQLQLSVLSTSEVNGESNVSGQTPATTEQDEAHLLFLQRATAYEEEIGKLRKALADSNAKIHRIAFATGDDGTNDLASDNYQATLLIEKAKRELEADRERLSDLRSKVGLPSPEGSSIFSQSRSFSRQITSSNALEDEEEEEQAELKALTNKYLEQGGHDDDDKTSNHEHDDEANLDDDNDDDESKNHETAKIQAQIQRHIQADLARLSRSITSKEELVLQLKASQEKYASMREFYEDKLHSMEESLAERESEREQLLQELSKLKVTDALTRELEDQLREKDSHIANLRKKHKELKDLTSVSSRNAAEISKLMEDVKSMKRKKVDLQKQLTEERKQHTAELKRLQKSALQKDREVFKWKKASSQQEAAAQLANQVARSRLEELGLLRAKYKDSEKRLRMQSVKQGMMAKAGLDPVIVGRRDTKSGHKSAMTTSRGGLGLDSGDMRKVDVDSIRDYFDQKVAEVVRREALADKLAKEWEEHFELSSRRNALSNSGIGEDLDEAVQSLQVQIQFKEDRIRQLARRLGKQADSSQPGAKTTTGNSFLYDSEFARLSRGTSPEQAKETAARVLFGMIVRERRRVSTLAKTASGLDERVQTAEQAAEISEAALRSYKEEQAHAFASLANSQHEHLLSLMDMVKDESNRNLTLSGEPKGVTLSSSIGPQLLVLADERIALLENQLDELKSSAHMSESYRRQLDELTQSFNIKSAECESLKTELSDLRASLRQVRETVGRSDGELDILRYEVLETVDEALHPSPPSISPGKPRKRTPRSSISRHGDRMDRPMVSPRLKKHIELMHSSDSAEDDETPEWVNDIMADLALIAEGKVPPSLQDSPALLDAASQFENASVFDRLANPQTFTGTQKIIQAKVNVSKPASPRRIEERAAKSAAIARRLDKLVVPSGKQSSRGGSGESPRGPQGELQAKNVSDQDSSLSQKGARSVFDRLVSPSHYTGTQKEKFQATRAKRDQSADDAASRILDDILVSSDTREIPHELNATPRSNYEDYTQQDVFERLQKTTTQAYAVKQNPHVHDDDGQSVVTAASSSERATFNQLKDNKRPVKLIDDPLIVPDKPPQSEYTRLDVFERLQRTTTEAYANKTR